MRNWATIVVAVAVAAVPLAAQDVPGKPASMTVTGCVERADQVMLRDALGSTVDSQTYVLVKAEEGSAEEIERRPASPPSSGDAPLGTMYRLDVDSDTMNPHVGHRVEIVGAVTAAAPEPVGTTGVAGQPTAAARLKVSSVKMLSSTCSR